MRNLVGVGVWVICLLCLSHRVHSSVSPISSVAQPGLHQLHPMAGQTPYIPMRVLRGFKRQVSLADRGMMMGLGKRGVIGDRGMMMGLGKRSSGPWEEDDTEY